MSLAKTFLAIGISLLFAVFFAYAVYVVYEPPLNYGSNTCYSQYDCYSKTQVCYSRYDCYGSYVGKGPVPVISLNYNNSLNESQIQDCTREQSKCIFDIENSSEYKTCFSDQENCLQESMKTDPQYIYSRNSFYILALIGLAAIIAGMFLIYLEGIGSGLIGGGIILILWNIGYSWQYVSNLNKYVKLILLGLILVILIYLGYKKIENAGSKKITKINRRNKK